MRKILIVEDNDVKARELSNFLVSSFSLNQKIPIARSYRSGVKSIQEEQFDLIILDMTMNTFDVGKNESGGKPQAFAGKHVLDQMDRYDIETPVIVVTGFETFGTGFDTIDIEQLDKQLAKSYEKNYRGYVYYHASQSDWKQQLQDKIGQIFTKENNA